MRKLIKCGVLGIVIIALGWNLSQCTGGNPGNMRQYEIIDQIKSKMKSEMDRIGFEVDFSDYEFQVKVWQSLATFGTVTVKDKRYNYEPIQVYKGNFKEIENDKIGINPIIFVAHGYQDYVVNNVFNNKELGNSVEEAIKEVGGELPVEKTADLSSNDTLSLDYPIRERTEKEWRDAEFKGSILFFEGYIKQERQQYLSYFKNQNTKNLNYADFYRKLNFLTIVDILVTSDKNIDEMESKIQKMYNPSYLLIRIAEKK